MVGKRKRDTSVLSRSQQKAAKEIKETKPELPAATESSAQDRLRKFFEAQFQPLEVKGTTNAQKESQSDSEEDDDDCSAISGHDDSESGSEWSGFEGEEDNAPVEVVEYEAPSRANDEMMDKRARKAFMVSRPCLPLLGKHRS